MKKVMLVLMMFVVVGLANAAFTETFDSFPVGSSTAYESWEDNAGFDVVSIGTGDNAIKSNTYTDKTFRHDATGVDFGLTLAEDGIEYGFDFMEETSTGVNMRMYLRKQRLAVYAPSFGLSSIGGIPTMVIRPAGESGDTIVGNSFGGSAYGTEAEGGYWVKGEWLQFKIILTGYGFDTATVKAYNLSRGGLEIPTGLTDIALGVNPKFHSGWTGMNFRGGTPGTNIDNAYVTDYTIPEPATIALLGLGGLLLRRKKD